MREVRRLLAVLVLREVLLRVVPPRVVAGFLLDVVVERFVRREVELAFCFVSAELLFFVADFLRVEVVFFVIYVASCVYKCKQ